MPILVPNIRSPTSSGVSSVGRIADAYVCTTARSNSIGEAGTHKQTIDPIRLHLQL